MSKRFTLQFIRIECHKPLEELHLLLCPDRKLETLGSVISIYLLYFFNFVIGQVTIMFMEAVFFSVVVSSRKQYC